MGKSLRNWASITWGEEVTSLHRIPSLILSNSSADLLLMKERHILTFRGDRVVGLSGVIK